MSDRPLAVSIGDPAGIGLEIAAKAWAARREARLPAFCLIGDDGLPHRTAAPVRTVTSLSEARSAFAEALPLLPIGALASAVIARVPDPNHAPIIVGAIERGTALCLAGEASALVTLPIAKAPLYDAGFSFPGHTEFIAELTQTAPIVGPRGPVMMLAGETLRVALATIHAPLREVPALLSAERIGAVARVVDAALRRDFGIAAPRIALAGLNPHAGEGGAIGREEVELLVPLAAALRAEGIAITDPIAPDSLFHAEARAGYDCALCLYHDQGLIPLKTLHFWDAVNVTLGLPIVRTSPDHGTGFDIAGRGCARADSFIAACRMAADMAARRAG
jgi:4-hydroxythreonine-4-phosphate dehydrogenase